jgi:exonuclease SbcC
MVEDRIRKGQVAVENAQDQISSLIEHLDGILPASSRERLKQLPCAGIVEFLQELEQDLRKAAEEEQRRDKDHSDSMTKANEIKSKLNSANEQRQALEKELDDVKEYLAGKGKQPRITCDRCGSILTKAQWKKHLKERQENVQELQKQADAYSEKLESAQAHVEECRKSWDEARTALANLGSAMPIVKQIETQRRIIEQTHDPGLIKARSELLVQLRSLLALDSTRTDEEVVNAALSLPREINHLVLRMQDLADDVESFDEEVLNPQIVRVNEAKTAQAQALQLESEIDLDEKRILLLDLIRKSLREVEPAVRRNFVTKITQSANDYLKRLYGGAELENFELTEDYQFLVTRAGCKRHARRLSGGQQVLASMAFLLALSEVLSQLDFLILDEPTTHLDESRRKELVNVLENLKRVPQLIIVDHHPELLAAADTPFQVTLTREGQSQVALISE